MAQKADVCAPYIADIFSTGLCQLVENAGPPIRLGLNLVHELQDQVWTYMPALPSP